MRPTGVLSTLTRNTLKRSPVTAIVLVLFVALSAMLASSAGALLVTVSGATDSLMRQARSSHFVQMHAGDLDEQRLNQFAAANNLVEDHAVSLLLNVDGAAIRLTGDDTDATLAAGLQDNAFVTQNADFDWLLDLDGQVIDPEPATVWLPVYYQQALDLHAGDLLTVTGGGFTHELTVAGFMRDSQMNPSFAGSKRLLVASADHAALADGLGEFASPERIIEFRLTDASAVAEFETQYRDAGLEANGPTVTWSLFSLLNSMSTGITAALVVLVTLLLVGISLLCVRFTLLTSIEQDYREIGVLKAIGLRRADLRRLYSHRYLILAGGGALVGWLLSFGLTHLLLREVRLFLGPASHTLLTVLIGVVASGLIVGVIALTVRRILVRLEHVSPVQAIRTGVAEATSPRGRRGSSPARRWTTVAGSSLPTPVLLGLRDLGRRPGLYAVPAIIFTLAAVLLILPQSLYATITSPQFVTYMGVGVSDIRIDVRQPADPARVAEASRELAADPRVAEQVLLETAAYTALDPAGKRATVKVESGNLAAFPVTYLNGGIPATPTEIALSALQAEALGAAVGDEIVVTPVRSATATDGALTLVVSGIYQDITNGGKTGKMLAPHTSADLMWSVLYADAAAGADVEALIAEYAAQNPDLKVNSVAAYVEGIVGGSIAATRDASVAAVGVGLLVSALIAALFLRLLLVRDVYPIAAMRAIGFRDSHIRGQYLVRTVVLLLLGTIVGAILSAALGSALAGVLLRPIGISRIRVVADPLLAYVASPLALLLTVVGTAIVATRTTGRASIAATIKD